MIQTLARHARQACLGLAILLPGSGVMADPTALRPLNSVEQGKAWEAVGRLDIDGSGFCTGALISEDLVLTAAHCLFDPETGVRLPDERIEFRAGWRSGRAAAYRWVRQSVIHPDYVYAASAQPDRVRHDVALLQLDQPIRASQVMPFETDLRPRTGGNVGVVSYAHDRAEVPALQETCEIKAAQQGLLVLSCEADFGASGAPVFSFEGGQPRIVSVLSAKAAANGLPVSLGTVLEQPLDALKRSLLEDSPFLKAATRRETGAKFVRP